MRVLPARVLLLCPCCAHLLQVQCRRLQCRAPQLDDLRCLAVQVVLQQALVAVIRLQLLLQVLGRVQADRQRTHTWIFEHHVQSRWTGHAQVAALLVWQSAQCKGPAVHSSHRHNCIGLHAMQAGAVGPPSTAGLLGAAAVGGRRTPAES